MSAPTSKNNVTARKLSSCITSLWGKCKDFFQAKLPTSGSASSTYAINISGNAASATTSADAANHISNTSNPHGVTKSQVGLGNVTNDSQVKRSEMGTANGVATLDAHGIINTSQLPSYVDDVLEYSSKSNFPATGESGKIYVATDTNKTWRWSGSTYTEISPSLALGETDSTAYRGDRGKIAYDHSQSAHARTDATKTEASSTNGKIKINGTDTTVYTHPTYTGYSSKGTSTKVATITTNTGGHVTSVTETPIDCDALLKTIGQDTTLIGTDTLFLRHDAIGQASSWKASNVSVLWNWIKGKIASVLELTTRDNDTPYFGGLAANAVSANSAARATHATTADTATASQYAATLWAGSADGAHVFATINTSDPDHPVSQGEIEIGSSGTTYTKITAGSITAGSQGGGFTLDGTGLSINGTGNGSVEFNYSGGLELIKTSTQFAIKVDNINENITVAKSGNTTTISGPQIITPKLTFSISGGADRISLQVNNSDNNALRLCSANEPLTLYGLVASSFTGNLTGNVTGRCSGSVDYVQNTSSSTIANDAPFSSCKTYFEGSSMTNDTIRMVYNTPGLEKTMIFSKNDNYGTILRWGYTDKYLYIARKEGGSWKASDWEKISAGYADSAGSATKAAQDQNGMVINTTYLPRNNVAIDCNNTTLKSSMSLSASYATFDTWGSQSASTWQVYAIHAVVEIVSLVADNMTVKVRCVNQNSELVGSEHTIRMVGYGTGTVSFALNCVGNSYTEQILCYDGGGSSPKVAIKHSYTRTKVSI